jgi:translation initiation factor IF-3
MDMMINEEIRDREIRLIGPEGEQLGIMSARQALDIAEEKELDLVKIAPTAKPPVCKLMDYGKYRFEQSKREKEARKNQKVISVKEVRLSPTIEEHDMQVRMRDCIKFLQNGDKVKVSIRFRGRMITHSDVGLQVMNEFYNRVKEYAVQDRKPSTEGRTMTMMLSPKQDK